MARAKGSKKKGDPNGIKPVGPIKATEELKEALEETYHGLSNANPVEIIEEKGEKTMGTRYCGACHDCKKYIDLDKFFSWNAYEGTDHCTIEMTDFSDYHEDGWIYRALRLHVFLSSHNGHRIGVYREQEIDKDEFTEQFPWPEGLRYLTERIDMSPSLNRIIINTRLGELFIDDRGDDINCFRFIEGKRVDVQLLKKSPDERS